MGNGWRSHIVTEVKMGIIGAILVIIGITILLGSGYVIIFLPRHILMSLFGKEMGSIGGVIGCIILLYTSYKLLDVKQ